MNPKKLRVIVVEDNPVVQQLLEHGLRRLRAKRGGAPVTFEVVGAPNGEAAWNLIVASPPDLVVTDLYMPVLTGLELLQRIRTTPGCEKVKVLGVSGSMPEAQERFLVGGADGFLAKPLRREDLVKVVVGMLKLG
jgi:CheY-like chemotaxis protein